MTLLRKKCTCNWREKILDLFFTVAWVHTDIIEYSLQLMEKKRRALALSVIDHGQSYKLLT